MQSFLTPLNGKRSSQLTKHDLHPHGGDGTRPKKEFGYCSLLRTSHELTVMLSVAGSVRTTNKISLMMDCFFFSHEILSVSFACLPLVQNHLGRSPNESESVPVDESLTGVI
jgi:hypothetical protein